MEESWKDTSEVPQYCVDGVPFRRPVAVSGYTAYSTRRHPQHRLTGDRSAAPPATVPPQEPAPKRPTRRPSRRPHLPSRDYPAPVLTDGRYTRALDINRNRLVVNVVLGLRGPGSGGRGYR